MDQLFQEHSEALRELDQGVLSKKLRHLGLLYHYVNAYNAMKHAHKEYTKYVETDTYTFGGGYGDRWTTVTRLRREKDETYWRAHGLFLDLKGL
jgi:hypothetical protein